MTHLRETGQGKYTVDYPVGTRVLSFDHQQPGEVVNSDTHAGFFDVRWDRWPHKPTRRYHVGDYHEWCWKNWPIIVEEDGEPTNEELAADPDNEVFAADRLVFVDPIADAKNALQNAFTQAATFNGDDLVIDVNKLFLALANNGWTYSKGE